MSSVTSKIPTRWSKKTSDTLRTMYPTLKSEQVRFAIWAVSRKGLEINTKDLQAIAKEQSFKGKFCPFHLAHATRIIANGGTGKKASVVRAVSTVKRGPGRPKGSKNKTRTTVHQNYASDIIGQIQSLETQATEHEREAQKIRNILSTIANDVEQALNDKS